MNKRLIPYTLLGLLAITLHGCGKKVALTVELHDKTESVVVTKPASIDLKNNKSEIKPVTQKNTAIKEPTEEEQAEIANQQIIEHFKKQMGEEAFNKSYRGKMFNKDPKVLLLIDDHDPQTAKQMRKDLAFREANGYTVLPQEEMDDLYKTKQELFSSGNASENAKFELSKLPQDLDTTYSGFTREGIPPNAPHDMKASVIRRAFDYNGSTILLQEESSKNGSSHFTEEFINEKIGDYPAVFNVYHSKDNKQIQELEWNTDKYRYSLESISSKPIEQQRKELKELAEQITKMNK